MDEQTMQLDARLVVVVSLASELRGVNEADPGRDVALQADEDAPSRVIVRIIDALREAGIHIPNAVEIQRVIRCSRCAFCRTRARPHHWRDDQHRHLARLRHRLRIRSSPAPLNAASRASFSRSARSVDSHRGSAELHRHHGISSLSLERMLDAIWLKAFQIY